MSAFLNSSKGRSIFAVAPCYPSARPDRMSTVDVQSYFIIIRHILARNYPIVNYEAQSQHNDDCYNDSDYPFLAMQQTDQTKKQQKRIPQITTRLEQIDKVLNKLYEDNALGTIPQDRYEQMSQKYSEEYYTLKAELSALQEQLSAFENAGGRAQKFVKLIDRYADFTDLTPTVLNEFISRIEVHERDKKRAKQAIQHIGIYFNHIGRFENELTQLAEPTEQEIRQMREEIEEARKEKSRAYHRNYSREYRARNLEKQREYDRIKAREYRAKKKAQAAAALSAP